MPNQTPNYHTERKLPQKFVVDFDDFKTLTWRERLKILIGYNLILRGKLMVDRRHADVRYAVNVLLTKHVNAKEVVKENITESQ